jgi:hypothetical protein
VCASLLGLLGWVLREMIAWNRDVTAYVKANTEVLVGLKDSVQTEVSKSETILLEVRTLRSELQDRPCALAQKSGLMDLLQDMHAQRG